MKNKGRLVDIIIVCIFVIGAGVLAYPTVSNLWNEYRDSKLITVYSDSVDKLSDEEKQLIMEEARSYNEGHVENEAPDAFGDAAKDTSDAERGNPYDSLLNPMGNGIMGTLFIPEIDCYMPVYHGISTEVLEKGLGHIEGTSLPVGGRSTHCVIVGHRGLPGAKMFSDLDRLKKGNRFFLTILDENLAYEVDQIKTVLPEDTRDLTIEPERDYVTLLTCTPYGINTHRLLVRGHRIPYVEPDSLNERQSRPLRRMVLMLLIALGVTAILITIVFKKNGKRK